MSKKYEFHEAANIFPLDEENLQSLADDIRRNGLLCPIELFEGKIIDGRRRKKACELAGVEPDYVEVTPDNPVGYVVSLNFHRRHLSTTQAAVCAARAEDLLEQFEDEARKRHAKLSGRPPKGKPVPNCAQVSTGKSRDRLAATFGVSHATVGRARQVIRDGIPELVAAVETNRISAHRAARISTYPKPIQKQLVKEELKTKPLTLPRAMPPRKPDKHEQTEQFAVSIADISLTQLKRIPKGNPFRKTEFSRVQSYLTREIKK